MTRAAAINTGENGITPSMKSLPFFNHTTCAPPNKLIFLILINFYGKIGIINIAIPESHVSRGSFPIHMHSCPAIPDYQTLRMCK